MTVLEYLKDKLSFLAECFSIIVKYHYDDEINRHIVEITPQEVYYSNSNLDNCWIDISLEFMNLYPNESISFVSSDSTLTSKESILVFDCKKTQEINIEDLFTELLNTTIKINYAHNFNVTPQILPHFINYKETQSIIVTKSVDIKINNNAESVFNYEKCNSDCENQLPQAA